MTFTVTCRECGQTKTENSGDQDRLARERLCFQCDYWLEEIAAKDDPRSARIDGSCFFIGPDGQRFPGFGGQRFNIRFRDGRVMTTANLWSRSRIPAHFRSRLPDNAEFIDDAGQKVA